MVAFGNPVAGLIRPPGSPYILGNFRVTCSFACHEARNPPTQGTDIGDGTCGKPVLAMTSGVISLVRLGKLGSSSSMDASIFRIKRPDGYEPAVAHLRIKAGLAVGQSITEGTVIGTLDKVGASACHVHVGCKDPNGVEIDVWPLLRQNGATEDDMLQGTNPRPVENRKVLTSTGNDGLRFRSSPFVRADNVLDSLPNGTELHPDFIVDGTKVGAAADPRWYGSWTKTAKGIEFGYVSVVFCSAAVPIESAGYDDDDLNAAKKVGADAVANAADLARKQF